MFTFPDFPYAPAPTTPRGTLEALIPVPEIVQQRAWECAVNLCAEHPAELREWLGTTTGTTVLHWAHSSALRGPEAMTWADSRLAFRADRALFGVRT